jgi:hypothetical protein
LVLENLHGFTCTEKWTNEIYGYHVLEGLCEVLFLENTFGVAGKKITEG